MSREGRALVSAVVAGLLHVAAARSPAATASAPRESVAQQLIRLQAEVVHATEARDSAALDRLIADDFVLAFHDGQPGSDVRYVNKARVIARWTARDTTVEALPTRIEAPRAEVAGDVGVVFARIVDRWRDASGEHTATTAVADVWVKRGGRWRWFAAQETVIPGAP